MFVVGGETRRRLRTSEDVLREILHHGDAAIDVSTQVLIDFSRNEETAVGWNVSVLQDDIASVVGCEFSEGKIALAHENLLDASVTPAM